MRIEVLKKIICSMLPENMAWSDSYIANGQVVAPIPYDSNSFTEAKGIKFSFYSLGSNEKNKEMAYYFNNALENEDSIKKIKVNIESTTAICIEVTVEFEEENSNE